jgi:gliding motility-associated-like protein
VNTGNTPITATVTVTAQYVNGSQLCTGNSETFTITVNPLITMQAVSPVVACSGDQVSAISFSGNAQPGVFNWTNSNPSIGIAANGTGAIPSFVATNPGSSAQVAIITVTPGFVNGVSTCTISPVTFSVTVNPLPQLVAVPSQVLCVGSLVNALNFNSNTINTNYTWTNSNSTIGLSSNGTGSIPAFLAQNSSNSAQVGNLVITSTYTNAGLSCQTMSSTNITVNPTPNVVDPANQNLCVGNQSLPVLFTGNVSGTVYAWTNNAPSLGIAAGGTGNIASITAQNSTQTSLVATFSVQAQYTNAGQLCLGNTETFTITVNPQPQVIDPQNQVVCNGAQVAAINFTGPLTGTTYVWSNNNSTIGLATSGTGNINMFTAVNTGNAPITATVTVTAQYVNGSQLCTGNSETFTIIVNPTPVMIPTQDVTACSGSLINGVSFSSIAPPAGFVWSNNQPLIGLPANGNGNILPFTPIISTTIPVTSMIQVSAFDTYNNHTCLSPADTFYITVNPIPNFNAIPSSTVCAGATVPSTFITGNVINATYNWTNNNATIGLPNFGTGNLPSYVAINNGLNPITATIEMAPSFTNNQVVCYGTIQTFTITVNPTPQVAGSPDQVICSGSIVNGVQMQGTLPNAYYTWTNSIPSIGLAANGTGNIPSFVGLNLANSPVVAQINYTPNYTNNGVTCQGVTQDFTVTINPIPAVLPQVDVVVCDNEAIPSVVFTGPVPGTNYAWSNNNLTIGLNQSNGSNVINSFIGNTNTNTPNIAQIIVDATYTNAGVTCQGNIDTFIYVVNPIPNVLDPLDQVICASDFSQLIDFTGSVPGTDFNWINNTSSIGLPSVGTGDIAPFVALNSTNAPLVSTVVVQASYTNMNTTCLGNTEQMFITVNPRPNVEPVVDQVVCHNDNVNPIQFSGNVPGTVYSWTNTETSIGLALNGVGNIAGFVGLNPGSSPVVATVDVIPSYTNAGLTCTGNPDSFTITVNPWAYLQNLPFTICSGQNTQDTIQTTIGAVSTWSAQSNPNILGETQTIQNSSVINDALINTSNVQQVVVYDVNLISQPYGCNSGPYSILVSVQPPVSADFDIINPLNCSDVPILFDNNSVGNSSYEWVFGDGNTATTYNGNNVYANFGLYQVTLTATDASTLCQDSMSMDVEVLESPEVGFTASITEACEFVNVIFTDTIQDPTTTVYWTFGDGEISNQYGQVDHQFAQPGCYDITLYVTGTNGCTVADTAFNQVCVIPAPIASFTVDNPVHLLDDATFFFDNQSQNALYYDWSFGDGDTSVANNPIHLYDAVGEYLVTLTASNELGCIDTANLTIVVRDEFLIYVPNTFTPNQDGTNDTFRPFINDRYVESSYRFVIYNRWGEMVFESYNDNVGWDGTYGANLNFPAQDGVYQWMIQLKMKENEKAIHFNGHVTLIK